MNWSSYFATGDVKYLKKIISDIQLADDRKDMNLFLTGITARWSLCSNAKEDKKVKDYLFTLKDKSPVIGDILKKEPEEFNQEMVDVLKEQRAKGIWQ